MSFWDSVAADVSNALGGQGLNLTIAMRKRTKTGTEYAPVFVNTYHRLTGASFDIEKLDEAGTFIGVTGKRLLIRTAEGIAPTKSDEIMIDGAEAFLAAPSDAAWTGKPITSVKTLAPAATAVLYTVFIDG